MLTDLVGRLQESVAAPIDVAGVTVNLAVSIGTVAVTGTAEGFADALIAAGTGTCTCTSTPLPRLPCRSTAHMAFLRRSGSQRGMCDDIRRGWAKDPAASPLAACPDGTRQSFAGHGWAPRSA